MRCCTSTRNCSASILRGNWWVFCGPPGNSRHRARYLPFARLLMLAINPSSRLVGATVVLVDQYALRFVGDVRPQQVATAVLGLIDRCGGRVSEEAGRTSCALLVGEPGIDGVSTPAEVLADLDGPRSVP